jgi:hypothetical protein
MPAGCWGIACLTSEPVGVSLVLGTRCAPQPRAQPWHLPPHIRAAFEVLEARLAAELAPIALDTAGQVSLVAPLVLVDPDGEVTVRTLPAAEPPGSGLDVTLKDVVSNVLAHV